MGEGCCTSDYGRIFDLRSARRELDDYLAHGPDRTTQRLLDALITRGVEGTTVLEIGAGVGDVQLELLAAGAASITDVDASEPYLTVAREEFARRGLSHRARFVHGDFVARAPEIEPADVVVLNRVVCCYPDMTALVRESTARARRLYGLVLPVNRWWVRLIVAVDNLRHRWQRSSFRAFVHPFAEVDRLVRAAGLEPRFQHAGWVWRTVVYERRMTSSPAGANEATPGS
ncbi:MAG TPA: class I SAM-dependent methyltransferase [candidate division Zixibacteria bacterium]|nr:class I SAM-dependent methyltransferase [candidate division Zixibacteria bacterium]